jgi:hypothetical protein
VEVVESTSVGGEPAPEPGQPLACRCQRCRVSVETEHPHVGVGCEDPLTVSPAADRRVDDDTGGHRSEHLDDLVEHDRAVSEVSSHGACDLHR